VTLPPQVRYHFSVLVNGTDIKQAGLDKIMSVLVVDQSLLSPDRLSLDFQDSSPQPKVTTAFPIGATVVVNWTTSGTGPTTGQLFTGEVIAVDTAYHGQESRVNVRALDLSHRMGRGTKTQAYLNVTYTDVVEEIAQRNGLTIGATDPTSPVFDQVTQAATDDWSFLRQLASDVGFDLYVSQGELNFHAPVQASSGPPPTAAPDSPDPTQITRGDRSLIRLRVGVTGRGQVGQVQVRGWDPQSKTSPVSSQATSAASAHVSGQGPSDLADALDGTSDIAVLAVPHLDEDGWGDPLVNSYATLMGGTAFELEAELSGNPALRAGIIVTLANFDPTVDGQYRLSVVHHSYEHAGGYHTSVEASDRRDRSLLGMIDAGQLPPRSRAARGVVPALVTNVDWSDDPANLYRVKVAFPWLDDTYESSWARVVQAGAGASRGLQVLPEVGDEVLVAFEQDDIDHPVVLGGLYNGQDTPPIGAGDQVSGGQVVQRAFVSRTGHQLLFNDSASSSEQSITLATGDGAVTVVLGGSNAVAVTVTDQRAVSVTTAGPVTVNATGDISLIGQQNVTITAASALQLSGASVQITADSGLTAQAGQLQLQGGITSITGQPIQLN
jgi:uncharacterized protein involved in type VI secretion and phage assembly